MQTVFTPKRAGRISPVLLLRLGLALFLIAGLTFPLDIFRNPTATLPASVSTSPLQTQAQPLQTNSAATPASLNSAGRSLASDFGQLPLSFEANAGQQPDAVKFLARGAGYPFSSLATR